MTTSGWWVIDRTFCRGRVVLIMTLFILIGLFAFPRILLVVPVAVVITHDPNPVWQIAVEAVTPGTQIVRSLIAIAPLVPVIFHGSLLEGGKQSAICQRGRLSRFLGPECGSVVETASDRMLTLVCVASATCWSSRRYYAKARCGRRVRIPAGQSRTLKVAHGAAEKTENAAFRSFARKPLDSS
jgi:hypothetical protein